MNYIYMYDIYRTGNYYQNPKVISSDIFLQIGKQYKVQINDTIYTGCIAVENDDDYTIDIIVDKYVISNAFVFLGNDDLSPDSAVMSSLLIYSTDASSIDETTVQIKIFEVEPDKVLTIEPKYISNNGYGHEEITKTLVAQQVAQIAPAILVDEYIPIN